MDKEKLIEYLLKNRQTLPEEEFEYELYNLYDLG